jgi:Cu/Ag efflux protein CusF
MRCMALMSSLVLVSAALCSGVGAAVTGHRAAYGVTLPRDISRLPPVETHPLAAGRVVAVDSNDGKVTVEHAPIPRFYLERMTRIFPVADRTMLTGLTPGDKIRFDLQRQQGRYIITHIENSN